MLQRIITGLLLFLLGMGIWMVKMHQGEGFSEPGGGVIQLTLDGRVYTTEGVFALSPEEKWFRLETAGNRDETSPDFRFTGDLPVDSNGSDGRGLAGLTLPVICSSDLDDAHLFIDDYRTGFLASRAQLKITEVSVEMIRGTMSGTFYKYDLETDQEGGSFTGSGEFHVPILFE